ncbi:hypothetical protein E3Q23_02779 [Wallemia mellicola]|uniref:Alpha/beta-hydrolase n=1 Tax=Wallemia mellicola TaxID=1708541 RepID=A0A4T0LVG5_9BASI|nr:hypothetical protein E3Q23_02779 [Wallemia mellicola]TIC64056.1 alpha/beta-hydrolase [Wallemia mellicola]
MMEAPPGKKPKVVYKRKGDNVLELNTSNVKSATKIKLRDSIPSKAKPKNKKDTKSSTQLYLDFGQRNAHTIECKDCGMRYTRGNTTEISLHETYHSTTIFGIEWNHKMTQSVKSLEKIDTLGILRVDPSNASQYVTRKVEEVHALLHSSLDAPSFTESIKNTARTYLAIEDNRIVASAVTTPMSSAYRVDISRMYLEGAQLGDIQFNSISVNKELRENIKVGIHRIFVLPAYRKKGIAMLLLNNIAASEVYGNTLTSNDIAFSQPTSDGARLAYKWSKHISTPTFTPRIHYSQSRWLSTVKLAHEKVDGSVTDEPIVVCHGLMGSKQNWRTLAKNIAQKTQSPVYTLDLRNHGTSPHAEPHDYTHMAADVSQFIEENNLKNVTLIGHSMGGKVVMALALSKPHLLRRLIVADMSPQIAEISKEFRAYTERMAEIENADVKSKKEADQMLQTVEPNMAIRQFLLTNAEMNKDTGFYKFRIPVEILRDAIPAIGDFPYKAEDEVTFDKPTTFVKGSNSAYLNHKNIPLAEKFFPNMKLVTFQAGHFVHTEKPFEFVQLVTDDIESDRSI